MTTEVDPFEAFEQGQAQGVRDPYPEWAELRRQTQQNIDHIQTNRPTSY